MKIYKMIENKQVNIKKIKDKTITKILGHRTNLEGMVECIKIDQVEEEEIVIKVMAEVFINSKDRDIMI